MYALNKIELMRASSRAVVTVHTGIQERGDEDITNRVFNG